MRLKSLKSKLLAVVSVLVILSGLIITLLVTRQYSAALRKAMIGQVENTAQTIALDAADKILVNDLVSLQKMLDQQIQNNPDAELYLNIERWPESRPYLRTRGAEELLGCQQYRIWRAAQTARNRFPKGRILPRCRLAHLRRQSRECCGWVFQKVTTAAR